MTGAYLATLGTAGVSQLVAVVLNNSALTVVGANRGCPDNLGRASAQVASSAPPLQWSIALFVFSVLKVCSKLQVVGDNSSEDSDFYV